VAGRGVFTGILVGTDGSSRAEGAVAQAARLASMTAASLEILFVIDTGDLMTKISNPSRTQRLRRRQLWRTRQAWSLTRGSLRAIPLPS
jgi:nucleotide-binding universal stress UspA family protein